MNSNAKETKMPSKNTARKKPIAMPEDIFTPEGVLITSTMETDRREEDTCYSAREKDKTNANR